MFWRAAVARQPRPAERGTKDADHVETAVLKKASILD